ncbi:hypothetical protein EN833_30260 [Mesorhizobium sp. M4B.F.Ca.ET.190.01.1.1]|uniref:hypothetical protein n=1 Tax=unclassified Mesorhizobium TaxID=325217 RepID=UPI000FD1BEB9|nr:MULTISPECIES: hypothetical protein [unclassified Mesorhizobium]RUW77279.1 hypothetical protein EOA31_05035 [Mesorhizobium sp. M4B.F.Ca.ET.049.02.1.2]TGS13120.1 hypothetical protein EN833_30260 [Mesorhizobium sp. M4B.F.Ca.ET.190.01.1.1]TGR01304.1 hypothetical protein EN843_30255 [Mesorhizobium sp. M4B.F.Ca.ET.200.01.1.1]TGT25500.1 hypothetical protein EN815_30245 [Mesorhizobium sp. M4B.F.Ca.ET.172.01.1.1]TGV23213.1 hypothetical protein EN786_25315 [Mesorhizobium sp. M4B.F.Ca.ET.143.01.1.1]
MKRSSTIYAVYHPPVFGLPFLAVVLKPDGTITSRQFETVDEARAFNKFRRINQAARRSIKGKAPALKGCSAPGLCLGMYAIPCMSTYELALIS